MKVTGAASQKRTVEPTVEPSGASYIVVASRNEHIDGDQIKEVAASVGAEFSDLNGALVARVIPIYTTRSHINAEAVSCELNSRGFESTIIAEEEISSGSLPIAVRAFGLSDDSVTAIGPRGQRQPTVRWSDLTLIVTGHLHFSTREIEQKQKKTHRKIVAERQLSTDEAVVDIYRRNEESAWRIRSNSFDFSCLGERKAITAFQNFAHLIELLRQRASSAEFNDDYVRLRPLLDKIWPIENSEQQRQRRRTGWRELEATVTCTTNEAQFDRYSRVLRRMGEQI